MDNDDLILGLAIIGCLSLAIMTINAIGLMFNSPLDAKAGHSWTETINGWKNYDRCSLVCSKSVSNTEFIILTDKIDYRCRCTIEGVKHYILFEQIFYFRE